MSKQIKLIRSIRPEVRVVDEAAGLVDYIASDETVDWYDEVVMASGWEFGMMRKNGPFVDSHDYSTIEKQLGEVVSFEVKGNQLHERVRWAKDVKENPLVQVGWKMTLAGFLKAVSVGFLPKESLTKGRPGFDDLAKQLKLDGEDQDRLWRIFTRQEQYELSACIIGANPNALAKSFEEGVIGEGDLAGLGFGEDEEFDFLQKASGAWENPALDEAGRAMVACEMKRIFAAKSGSNFGTTKTGNGESPTTRAAGEEAEQHAVWRKSFLKQLEAIG